MDREKIREYIIKWNTRFPVDRWWRKKYNLAFNSPTHRESNFIDQLIEYEEDALFDELVNKDEYKPNTGDWLRHRKITEDSMSDAIANFREQFKDLSEDE
jgi:hypothetical protein